MEIALVLLIIAVVFEAGNALVRRWPGSWVAVLPLGLVLALVAFIDAGILVILEAVEEGVDVLPRLVFFIDEIEFWQQ